MSPKPTVVQGEVIDPTETDETKTETVEKRPNVFVRGARKIKQNPKTALAVVGGALLVTAGAVAGRKTAPLYLEVHDSEVDVPPMLVTPDTEPEDTVA